MATKVAILRAKAAFYAPMITGHRPFVLDADMRGEVRTGEITFGRLSRDWVNLLTARREDITYVVYSYSTPIAWHDSDAGTWVVPSEEYTPITRRHQTVVRMALAESGLDYAE